MLAGPFNGITNSFNAALSLHYTYTRATALNAYASADNSVGKQLIYVPQHVFSDAIQIEYKHLYLRSNLTYTSSVFISTDNTQSLPGYFVADIEIGKDFKMKNVNVGLSFRVNNIADKHYESIAQRAMPGRNFEGSLRFKFAK